MNTPLLSVIVPVYNVELYISKCISSIITQTFNDIELLLIDDGSTDRSGYICDEYARNNSCIRVFHQLNNGVSSARNIGIDNARGKWITFVDSDDWVIPEFVEKIKEFVNSDYDIISFGCHYYKNGKKLYSDEYSAFDINFYSLRDCKILHHQLWGYAFKKEIFSDRKIRLNDDIRYAEDVELICRVFVASNKKIRYIGHSLYCYNWRDYSATSFINSDGIYDHIKVAKLILKLCKEWDVFFIYYIIACLQIRYIICQAKSKSKIWGLRERILSDLEIIPSVVYGQILRRDVGMYLKLRFPYLYCLYIRFLLNK